LLAQEPVDRGGRRVDRKEIWATLDRRDRRPAASTTGRARSRKDRRLLLHHTPVPQRPSDAQPADDRVVRRQGQGGRCASASDRDITNVRPLQTGNPGRIFENLIIISLPAGGAQYISNPGDTTRTMCAPGKLAWSIPQRPRKKANSAADTWPERPLAGGGGVHNWSELTIDEARGIAYIRFGTRAVDFYAATGIGDNLFGTAWSRSTRGPASAVATSRPSITTVDYDFPQRRRSSPSGTTAGTSTSSRRRPSRDSCTCSIRDGQPLWPIEEKPVPQDRRSRREDIAHPADTDAARRRLHGNRSPKRTSHPYLAPEEQRRFATC